MLLLTAASLPGCALLCAPGHSVGIRGRVVSRSAALPRPPTDPLVVLATPATGKPRPAPPMLSAVHRLDDTFLPSFLVVPVGRSVRFFNEDDIFHSFFSSSIGNAFDLGLLEPEDSSTVRFEHPGLVHVYCSLHAKKQSTILVAPTPHFAVVGPTGEFEVENLRPGRYVLETWSEGRAPQRVEVTVPPGGTKLVQIPID